MRPKGNSNLRNGFWKDHPCVCTCPSEASDLAQSLYERGLSADLKQSAQGVSIEINKDPGVCWGQRLAGTFFTHHLSLFWNSRLFPSPPGGVPSLSSPALISPVIKHDPFFLSRRHYPYAPPLPYSSQQLPSHPLSLLHSRVPSQRGHFTCFRGSGLSPLVLFIVGATLGLHLITWPWRSGGQPYGTIKTRGTVLGGLPPPDTRHCTDSRWNTP